MVHSNSILRLFRDLQGRKSLPSASTAASSRADDAGCASPETGRRGDGVEFARRSDDPVHRRKVSLPHHRARAGPRFADPSQVLGVDEEVSGRVDRQHLGDDPTSELGAELFGARNAIWTTLSLVAEPLQNAAIREFARRGCEARVPGAGGGRLRGGGIFATLDHCRFPMRIGR